MREMVTAIFALAPGLASRRSPLAITCSLVRTYRYRRNHEAAAAADLDVIDVGCPSSAADCCVVDFHVHAADKANENRRVRRRIGALRVSVAGQKNYREEDDSGGPLHRAYPNAVHLAGMRTRR